VPIQHVFTNAIPDGTNTQIVRPSDWNSAHAYTLQDAVSLAGNTAGVLADISSGRLILAGGANVTLSQNGNSVSISAGTAAPSPINFSAGTTSAIPTVSHLA
jgi:phage-related tail protein